MSADAVFCSCHDLSVPTDSARHPYTYVSHRSVYFGVSPRDVRGPRKDRYLMVVRRKIAEELRAPPWSLSLPHIGRCLGGRDHTTILSMLRGGKGKANRLERLVEHAGAAGDPNKIRISNNPRAR